MQAAQVKIVSGTYRGEEVHNQTFEMVKDVTKGAKSTFITVRPNELIGGDRDKIRVNVHPDNIEYIVGNKKAASLRESDEQVMARIGERFDILEEMTRATINNDVRAMIVVGPPGVGKSYGVEKQLEKTELFRKVGNLTPRYEIVKGAMTPIGLYTTLFNHSEANHVLVFDDCDSILMDDLSLNLLKAALDSGKKRTISWHADSNLLRREDIPEKFEFKGSVIFITNIKFDNIKSKRLQDHLAALQSRCHYLDLAMNTMRDRFLRIKQIHATGELFNSYNFKNGEADEIIQFMDDNKDTLRELSLRMALKIADLTKVSATRWQALAHNTVMKHSF
jgi:hypothetical protein